MKFGHTTEGPGEHERRWAVMPSRYALGSGIGLVLIAAGCVAYALMGRIGDRTKSGVIAPARVVQLDLLNGCGAKGVGAKLTSFLRTQGFDVVEIRNYTSFKIQETLVIDRVGNLSAARHVAAALGLAEDRVIQQLNPAYYVDVSVIIGSDYSKLRSAN